MTLIALAIGIVLVFALHGGITWLAHAHPQQVKRAGKWLAIAGLILIVLLLLRFGAPLIAAAIAAVTGIAALLNRLLFLWPLWRLWRARRPSPPPRTTPMTRAQAAQILGVPPDAPRRDIIAAHRKLMKTAHPDRGGSDYLAAQINQAKDILLRD